MYFLKCDVIPIDVHRHLEGKHCHHLQGQKYIKRRVGIRKPSRYIDMAMGCMTRELVFSSCLARRTFSLSVGTTLCFVGGKMLDASHYNSESSDDRKESLE
jgi:hypothetical protein